MVKLNSNILATWCKELTHWKRPWCWERLKVRGEGNDRGWDGWIASLTQWAWVCVNSGSWHWTREAWHAAVQGVTKSWIQTRDWTDTKLILNYSLPPNQFHIFTCFYIQVKISLLYDGSHYNEKVHLLNTPKYDIRFFI